MWYFVLGLLISFVPEIHAVERIHSFQSDIVMHQDAAMTVTETIKVAGEGASIRHGIVREFPTRYKDHYGNNYEVRFFIKEILLDGKPAPYHTRDISNGTQIYIGDENVYLSSGIHSFVISYETNRQLGFFPDHDELYWNVTGTGWRLPIDEVLATVQLPPGVPEHEVHLEGYTGYQGSKAQNYVATVDDGVAIFKTTRPLAIQQGLTVVVTWPKGFVHEPTQWQQWKWFLWDNKHIAVGLLGLLILLIFSLMTWLRFRRSQDLGTVIPLFYPPQDMSPGLMRYVINRGYDAKVLAADLVNMAVRGFITVHYEPKLFFSGAYTLKKKETPHGEFVELYGEIAGKLFGSADSIVLNEKNRNQINDAIDLLAATYMQKTNSYFYSPVRFTLVGVIIDAIFTGAILLVGSFEFVLLFTIAYSVIVFLFHWLMRGYAPEGLAIQKEIEGFKMFLAATEQERLKIIGTPPTRTPELYETYLPYAIALGVDKQWSRQFAPLFEKMAAEGHPYVAPWIMGGRFDSFNVNSFASDISSSMVSSIASSSSPPGSSSGSGGRGSSGGGGGGGGGGGW